MVWCSWLVGGFCVTDLEALTSYLTLESPALCTTLKQRKRGWRRHTYFLKALIWKWHMPLPHTLTRTHPSLQGSRSSGGMFRKKKWFWWIVSQYRSFRALVIGFIFFNIFVPMFIYESAAQINKDHVSEKALCPTCKIAFGSVWSKWNEGAYDRCNLINVCIFTWAIIQDKVSAPRSALRRFDHPQNMQSE